MTEPPEPRRPEEGGGEPDPDAPIDPPPGTNEWFDQLDDDVLLDQLGSGEELDKGGELSDMLGAWRDDVNEVPVPPIADRAQTIHDFNQEVDRATRPPDNGGPPSMINEGAAILANAAGNADTIRGMISGAEESIRSAAARLQEAIGVLEQIAGEVQGAAGGSEGEQLGGMGQQAASEVDNLLSAVAMFDPNEAMGLIGQFFDAVSQAAQKHSS